MSSHNKAKRKGKELSEQIRKLSESTRMRKDTAVKVRGRVCASIIKRDNSCFFQLEKLESQGGILGIHKSHLLEESDSEEDELLENPRLSSRKTECASVSELPKLESTDNNSSLPTDPPMKLLFIHPPSLIEELYPPFAEVTPREGALEGAERMLLSDNSLESLTYLVTTQWLVLFYREKPCPLAIWQWLFQIMCLSCDKRISSGAYSNISALVKGAKAMDQAHSIFFPSLTDIFDILTNLGVDKERLSDNDVLPQVDDEVFPPPSQSIFSNFCRLLGYLKLCVETCPEYYSVASLEDFIVLVANISLDTNLYQEVLPGDITEFFQALVGEIPSSHWACSVESLAGKLSALSQHHHNKLYVARLITGTTHRLSTLQMSVCRKGIELLIEKPPTTSAKTNTEFARAVLIYYYHLKPSSFDFKTCYKMYSILAMLALFLNLSQLVWTNAKSEREFAQLLGALSDKVRDDPNHPERGLVKDMLIQMKLEFEGRKAIKKQTDLSAVVFTDIS